VLYKIAGDASGNNLEPVRRRATLGHESFRAEPSIPPQKEKLN
jgi:hypothetical protein